MTFLEKCEECLREEGYKVENLGIFVRFKMNGMVYIIWNNDDDKDYLKMDVLFKDFNRPRTAVLEAANKINAEKKVVKVSVDKDNDITFSTEILLDHTPDIDDVLPRLISMLSSSVHSFMGDLGV